jgi:hypothetical protein
MTLPPCTLCGLVDEPCSCVPTGPVSRLPLLPPEVRAARAEDPTFAEVLGRARAKARRAEYRPEAHYPYRYAGPSHDRVNPVHVEKMAALVEKWERRGERANRYLRAL